MKIALIRRRFAAVGGAELYLQRLMASLSAEGHELHLYAESWLEHSPGVTFHPTLRPSTRARAPLAFAEAVEEQLRLMPHDLVFSLERTLRQDVYRAGDGVHATWLEQRRRHSPWWKRWWLGRSAFHRGLCQLEARTMSPAATRHIIVNAQAVGQDIQRRFGYPGGQIHLVRNGVDGAAFQGICRHQARERFGLQPNQFVLLFAGSGWERKGLRFVLELMRRKGREDPDLHLLVVGRGRCSQPGSNVQLAGPINDIPMAYAAADLMVFPPIYDPCANVVSEALASGLPVITSRMNGASELIEPGVHGEVLEDPSDIDGMIAAVEKWRQRGRGEIPAPSQPIDLAHNVAQTLRVLELAAAQRGLSL